MGEYLPFVSIDVWTMIFAWVNLLILFLLLKKFLFKPVNKILDERAAEIEGSYKKAEATENNANELKAQYEQKISDAKAEADGIIKTAVETANNRSDSILNEASSQAKHIVERAQEQIEQDKKTAMDSARGEIASMAVDVAEKLIAKELDAGGDEALISDIIDRI